MGWYSDKAKLSDSNIGVVSENGKLNVKLAKDFNRLERRNNWSNNYQQRWFDNQQQNNSLQLVSTNANNTQIKNVTAGVEDNDAANVKQLNDVKAASNTKGKR